jgi:hypothetical protein
MRISKSEAAAPPITWKAGFEQASHLLSLESYIVSTLFVLCFRTTFSLRPPPAIPIAIPRYDHLHSSVIMAGKKAAGENSKKAAGNAKKAEAAANKKAAADAKAEQAEAAEWNKGAKDNSKA